MSWGRFGFEIFICKQPIEGSVLKLKDVASFSMSRMDDVQTHRNAVAEYLKELDKALAENDPDDLEIVMNS